MQIHSSIHSIPYGFARHDDARALGAPVADAAASELEPETVEDAASQEATPPVEESTPAASADEQLSQDEQRQLALLKARDAEVKAHEQAHMAAGGQYVTGGPTYTYQLGPDGQRYAIGGEVKIDTAMSSSDPAANIEKARALLRAALAPAEPSTQDRRVAADARAMEIEAQRQLAEIQQTQREVELSASRDGGTDVGESAGDDGSSSGSISADGARLQQITGLFARAAENGVSRYA